MNLRSRLTRLARDGGPRARYARQRLPHCHNSAEALLLILCHPFPIFQEVVRHVPRSFLLEIVEAGREAEQRDVNTMIARSRLVRLEKQVRASPILARSSPDAIRRAEIARQRLPECTDAEEALRLIEGQPYDVYCTLLRLVPNEVLKQMHSITVECGRPLERIFGYTYAELLRMSPAELMELHRSTLRVRPYVARKR